MADCTKIEWCDATWNPITGCTPCSPGCDHCYAERLVTRFQHLHGYDGDPLDYMDSHTGRDFSKLTFHPERLEAPTHWRKPRRVFVCSMGDLFHEEVPHEWAFTVLYTTERAMRHTYIVLTKRAERMRHTMDTYYGRASAPLIPYPHVWLGVTVCNQEEADEKIPILLRTPAAKRFVSVEPMLGPVTVRFWLPHVVTCREGPPLDWVICGGETGPGARPVDISWVFSLRQQCLECHTPFFFKSLGSHKYAKNWVGPMKKGTDGVWHPHREFPQ